MFNLFRLCRTVEISKQPSTLSKKRNFTKSNAASTVLTVASTLLLVWTGPCPDLSYGVSDQYLLVDRRRCRQIKAIDLESRSRSPEMALFDKP